MTDEKLAKLKTLFRNRCKNHFIYRRKDKRKTIKKNSKNQSMIKTLLL